MSKKIATRGRTPDGAPNPIDVHVGKRVRIRRTLLGLSQMLLAERLGLTFQQVQKYERGGNRISCSRLYDISNVLDVPPSFFFDDMSDATRAGSPVAQITGTALPITPPAEGDPLTKRETLELVRAYYAAPEKIRSTIVSLLRESAK